MTGHGPHHNCMMCSMARATGMMKQHPKDCNCQEAQEEHKKEEAKKEESAYAA